ncbi:MAG: hypothetical protein KIT72_11805 [Polyangiaceae bacterium]|nr:hypothetical protein [Polyangiaceae bacterium]MCW5791098.1 hypothetical protein [Polyangiaceae bacterium]
MSLTPDLSRADHARSLSLPAQTFTRGVPRNATRVVGLGCLVACLLLPGIASAQYAEPPYPEPREQAVAYRHDHDPPPPDSFPPYYPSSTVRVSIGPVLRVAEPGVNGGLGAALDIGRHAAGLRLNGSWIQSGGDGGLAQYGAELWLDFGHDRELHPILAAGAGLVRLQRPDEDGEGSVTDTLGVASLRGSLQYVLPISGTDARASLDVTGSLPAIGGEDGPALDPWLTLGASVVVGF